MTDTSGGWKQEERTLLYVGISPAAPATDGKPPSRANLRKRIRTHFRDDAHGSTLRLTLGTLLGLKLRAVGRKAETQLNEWASLSTFTSKLLSQSILS